MHMHTVPISCIKRPQAIGDPSQGRGGFVLGSKPLIAESDSQINLYMWYKEDPAG